VAREVVVAGSYDIKPPHEAELRNTPQRTPTTNHNPPTT